MDHGQVYALCGSSGGTTNYYAMIRNSPLGQCREEPPLIRPRTIVLVTEFQPQTARSLSRMRLIRTVRAIDGGRGKEGRNTDKHKPRGQEEDDDQFQNRTIFLCGCCIRFVPLQRNFRGKLHKMCTTLRNPLSSVSRIVSSWMDC